MTRTAAIQFTEVTLEDMDKFLRRAFRAMQPQTGTSRGEMYYDLELSEKVVVRVYTSISAGRNQAADVGADAIRVGLYQKPNKPLRGGKWPIVKRTQNWRDNLKERIEDWIEAYHDHEEDIEAGRFVNW